MGNAGSPRTSLSVIESFYGEEVSAALARAILGTPDYQLVELADRLHQLNRDVEWCLDLRFPPEEPAPDLGYLTRGPFYADDSLLASADPDTPPAVDSPNLKHALLYCDQVAICDRALTWAEKVAWDEFLAENPSRGEVVPREERMASRELAEAVRRLVPLAPLIRRGDVVPFASMDHFDVGYERHPEGPGSVVRSSIAHRAELSSLNRYPGGYTGDLYLQWVIAEHFADGATPFSKDASLRERLGLTSVYGLSYHAWVTGAPERNIDDILQVAYPGIAQSEVERAMQASILNQLSGILPASSQVLTAHHLDNVAKVLLEGDPGPSVSVSSALRFRLPSLADVALSDTVLLRSDDEIYHELRDCLGRLATRVEQENPGTYADYQKAVHGHADDIVRPAYDQIRQARTRAKRWELIAGPRCPGRGLPRRQRDREHRDGAARGQGGRIRRGRGGWAVGQCAIQAAGGRSRGRVRDPPVDPAGRGREP